MSNYLDYAGLQRYDGIVERKIAKAIEDILPEGEASGNPAVINDASGFNAKSVSVTLTPIQSGSGDPSPTNIRPISGRDSVDLTVGGKNMLNPETIENGYIGADGVVVVDTVSKHTPLILVNTGNTITFSGYSYGGGNKRIHAYDENGDWIEQLNYTTGAVNQSYEVSATIPLGCKYIKTSFSGTDQRLQLELGSTATTYEPYEAPATATAEFNETIYGAEGDIVTGEWGKNSNIKIYDGSESWATYGTNGYYIGLSTMKSGNYQNGLSNWLKTASSSSDFGIAFGINNQRVYLLHINDNIEEISDVASLKTYLAAHPLQIVFPLATPETTTTPPQPISLNKGTNILTTDGDSVTVKYSKSLDSLVTASTRSLNLTKSAPVEEPEEVKETELTDENSEELTEEGATEETVKEEKK